MSENTSASEAGSDSVTDALTVAIEADGLVHDLRFLEDGFIKGVLETHLSHLPVDTVVTGSSSRDLREHLQEVVPEVLGDDIGIGFTFYPAIWFINDEGPRNAPSILKTPPANTSIEGYVEIREQGAEHFDRGCAEIPLRYVKHIDRGVSPRADSRCFCKRAKLSFRSNPNNEVLYSPITLR